MNAWLCGFNGRAVSERRGVLLLVTVSMLTLFMMLGAAYLVVASRARETSRALARRTLTADDARIDHAQLLDNVLLTVVRGTSAGVTVTRSSTVGPAPAFESLLGDRYGTTTISGSFSNALIYSGSGVGNTGPIITGTLTTAASIGHAAHLNGRILTFTGAGRPPTSHRILRASGTSPFALTITNPSGPYQFKVADLPANASPAIVNGREFAGALDNEAWDGFDVDNTFLAHVRPSGIGSSIVERPSFTGSTSMVTLASSQPDLVADNDNDGIADGVFFDFGLPSIPISSGTSVQLHASVLIVDLDGRFNVNAHGSLANMPVRNNGSGTSLYAPNGGTGSWTTDSETGQELDRLPIVPLGSGIGPAEVNPAHLFSSAALAQSGTNAKAAEEPGAGVICGMMGTAQVGQRPGGGRYSSGAATPRIGPTEGRHGGRAADWSNGYWTALIQPLRDANLKWASLQTTRLTPVADLKSSQAANSGIPPLWWLVSGTTFNSGTSSNGRPLPRAIYNSPPDLHGRMKMFTRPVRRETSDTDSDGRINYGIVPTVSFAKPEWSTNSNNDAETDNNPYEARLSSAGTHGGYIRAPTTSGITASPMPTNPFTLAELERLLRPYDIDANQLPPRLAAILGTAGEQLRTRLTSESWDTTGITDGRPAGAWGRIQAAFDSTVSGSASVLYGATPGSGILAGEVARGERLNLNRPLTGDKPATYSGSHPYYVQRQALFKDLYTLVVLLDDSPKTLTASEKAEFAQWSANVVEFRDADSTMTPFEYDTDIFDGWDVDGNFDPNGDGNASDATTGDSDRGVVFGAERPEAILTHTLAWESDAGGELVIGMHRPWHTYAHADGSKKIPAEPIDLLIDTAAGAQPENVLDLGRKSGSTDYPIWRLRIVADGQTRYVRFDKGTAGTNEFVGSTVTGVASTPKLGSDSWLCVKPNTNSLFGGAADWLTLPAATRMQQFTIDTGGVFKAPGTVAADEGPTGGLSDWPQPREGRVYLERLADPTSSPASTAWTADPKTTTDLIRYVVVDQAPLQIVRRSPAAGKTLVDYNVPTLTRRLPRLLLRRTKDETAFWKTDAVDPEATYDHLAPTAWFDGTRGDQITLPLLEESSATIDVAWMPWPNRPFFSPVELLLVPKHSAIGMLENYRLPLAKKPDSAASPPVTLADGDSRETDLPRTVSSGTTWPILDAVTISTPFAAIHDSWVDPSDYLAAQTGIHRQTHPVNQLSAYREPGRVNLNTVTNEQVWDAVVSGPLASGAVATGSSVNLTTNPANTMQKLLSLTGTGTATVRLDTNQNFIVSGTQALNVSRNPMHRLYTTGRLANVATTRSNVFAIWITLRQQDPTDPDSKRYHRAFYVIDRSIPVGYEAGQDHNVRDTVLLRRVIE